MRCYPVAPAQAAIAGIDGVERAILRAGVERSHQLIALLSLRAAVERVAPFLLRNVVVLVPLFVGLPVIQAHVAKVPGAFIADLVAL